MPFEVPSSWVWTTLGDIGTWQSGGTPSRANKSYYEGNIPWLKTGDLNDDLITDIPESITEEAVEKSSAKINPSGSVLIAMYGATIGKLGILTFPSTTNQACCACIEYNGVTQLYLFYYLLSQREQFIAKGGGGAQPNISKEIIVNTLIPIPPLKEQHAIVDRIKQYFALIERIESGKNDLKAIIKQTKDKILDLAIHGGLVPQDPNDEPASELLKRINPNAEITCDNGQYGKMPLEMPNSWEWCRLKDCCHIVGRIGFRGYTKDDLVTDGNGAITLSPSNIINGMMNYDKCTFISWYKYEESPEIQVSCGDILLVKTGSSFGKCALVEHLPKEATINPQFVVLTHISIEKQYLTYVLKSNYARNNYNNFVLGTAIPTFTQVVLGNMQIPLPPLEEQQRIVAKINELFASLDNIQKALEV